MANPPRNITEQLTRDEGRKNSAYSDHLGYLTIGVGRLIDARKGGGLSNEEIDMLLRNDIAKRDAALKQQLPWVKTMDEARYAVLLNMSFQMGVEGLINFRNTLQLIKNKQYVAAAAAMLQSKWATQTPERAKRLSVQMQTGVWQ